MKNNDRLLIMEMGLTMCDEFFTDVQAIQLESSLIRLASLGAKCVGSNLVRMTLFDSYASGLEEFLNS